jgi:hypothetical protein
MQMTFRWYGEGNDRIKLSEIILCEPFFLKGKATDNTEEQPDRYQRFCALYDYAKVVKKIGGRIFFAVCTFAGNFVKGGRNFEGGVLFARRCASAGSWCEINCR